jgi:predicted amidohydrolase YtcJ
MIVERQDKQLSMEGFNKWQGFLNGFEMAIRIPLLGLCLICLGAPASFAQKQADLLLYNGHVITVDDLFSIHTAVAVKNGVIVAVGDDNVRKGYTAAISIDLHGRTLMPGFVDTHIHIQGAPKRWIDLSRTTSIQQLQDQLREKAKLLGSGQWITGSNWDEAHFAEKRNPTKEDLDVAAPDNPVVLTRAGGHSSVGNSKALQLAGITRSTPDPPQGLIERGAGGEPNGMIRERSDLYTKLVPRDTPAELRPTYVASLKGQLKLGITSMIVAGASIEEGQGLSYPEFQSIYKEYSAELPRATVQIGYPGPEKLKAWGHKTGDGDDRLRVGSIGETAFDGGFTGPTAWTLEDYKGQPGFRGRGRFTDQEALEMVETGAKLGWQFGVHAIGDAAIQQAVKIYDQVLSKYPKEDHRWYLCHFTIMPPDETMAIMAKDNILIAQQPNFLYNLEGRYVATLEGARLEHNNSLATPLGYGLFMAFGSDNLPIGPVVGLYAATTRKGPSGIVYGRDEKVSMVDAIRMYTRNGPYLTWEEHKKGTLEVGKLADMIVLDQDPLTVAADHIMDIKVDMTIIGGKILYDRSKDWSH